MIDLNKNKQGAESRVKPAVTGLLWLNILISACLAKNIFAASDQTTILTVEDHNRVYSYSLAQISQMQDSKIVTATPWTKGKTSFQGIAIATLLKSLHVKNYTKLKISALNQYWSMIPRTDIEKYNPILAIKQNGKYMPIRNKGPIWVIYPLSESDELHNKALHSRMVWQVSKIEIRN
jgi:hypothetical protein